MLPVTIAIAYTTGDLTKSYEYPGWSITSSVIHLELNKSKGDGTRSEFGNLVAYLASINVEFLFHFLLSCVFGFILMYSRILCTHYNSALTATVIAELKNVLLTYSGKFVKFTYMFRLIFSIKSIHLLINCIN